MAGSLRGLLRPLAEAGEMDPVPFFPFVEDLDQLEVDPGSGLFQREPPSLQEGTVPAVWECAHRSQPFQVDQHLFKVPIERGEGFIHRELRNLLGQARARGRLGVLALGHTPCALVTRPQSSPRVRRAKPEAISLLPRLGRPTARSIFRTLAAPLRPTRQSALVLRAPPTPCELGRQIAGSVAGRHSEQRVAPRASSSVLRIVKRYRIYKRYHSAALYPPSHLNH